MARTLEQLRYTIQRQYKKEKTWRKVAQKFKITSGMAWRIAHGYEPKEAHIRHVLDLPALAPAPVCPKCGNVHVTKRCTLRRSYSNLFSMPMKTLREAITNREEI